MGRAEGAENFCFDGLGDLGVKLGEYIGHASHSGVTFSGGKKV